VTVCTACGESKQVDDFAFRYQADGKRHRRCKTCIASYGRKHYSRNRQAYITRNVANMRMRRRALKARVWEYLLEHPCVDCGETDPVVLEFDHVEPESKRSEIYCMVQGAYGLGTLLTEIRKCEVRCANCHRRRTAAQFAWPKLTFPASRQVPEIANAPRVQLQRPELPRYPRPAPADIAPGHRVCRWCGLAKPLEQFHLRDKSKGTRHSVCDVCFTAYRRAHYRLNREAYIRRNNRVLRVRGGRWMRRLFDHLIGHPCVDCGASDPVVLEFDHVDPSTKREAVGFLARSGYPWPTVLAELDKCQVRCANCHRRRTAVQFDWPKLQVARSGPGGTRTPETSRMRTERSPN
jgi:hypothetical protein